MECRYPKSTRRAVAWLALAVGFSLPTAAPAVEESFEHALARVDRALASNPRHVLDFAIDNCTNRRMFAVRLYRAGQEARAMRSLKYCLNLLKIPETVESPPQVDPSVRKAEALARAKARSEREVEEALALEPDLDHGLEIYRRCAACHMPEGWGLTSGVVPQLAGQHRSVIIKQLADIRAGNRANPVMLPYASVEAIGGAQAVADVAGYIDTLEISVDNGKGPGDDLELGARLYAENCAVCHGPNGEGRPEEFKPRIQSQHYRYLVTQFELIRAGKRRNADPKMMEQIRDFDDREMRAVLDHVSRLRPPEELRAPEGWRNPDFLE
ncbi:MAG TPA: c-type cytochrome [Deltaproteobacteria bacterium]|nr:c-type cytochrome [Deltaproteobacteria bacterium]